MRNRPPVGAAQAAESGGRGTAGGREDGAVQSGGAKRRRHCWVAGPEAAPGPHPGVVVRWRRERGAWSALVVYVVAGGDEDGHTVVQQWVPAELLSPA